MRVLLIYKYPDASLITKIQELLSKRGKVTSVTQFNVLASALKDQHDEVAIIIDSMTTAQRCGKNNRKAQKY